MNYFNKKFEESFNNKTDYFIKKEDCIVVGEISNLEVQNNITPSTFEYKIKGVMIQ